MTSTVKPHKAIEKLDENVRYCLWALISAPFEDQLKEMTTISKDVLGKLLCRGRFEQHMKKHCDCSIVEQLYISLGTILSETNVSRSGKEFLETFAKRTRDVEDLKTFLPPRRSLIGLIETKQDTEINYSIALERDKNSKMNGVKMFFVLDGDVEKKKKSKKIGFLLFHMCENALSFRGMHIHPDYRSMGLSRIFLSTWIQFCGKIDFECRTEKIDKPLLALTLQNLGFLPDTKGFDIEIASPSSSPSSSSIHIWSDNTKRLRSAYSKLYCRKQNIVLLSSRPTRSKSVRVFCTFTRRPTTIENNDSFDVLFYSARVLAFLSSLSR